MNIRIPLLTISFLILGFALQAQPAASELYQKAHELFQKGEIEKAIEQLEGNQLDSVYQVTRAAIEQARKEIASKEDSIYFHKMKVRQLVKSYMLKAGLHELLFQYQEAEEAYQKAVRMYKESGEKPVIEKWWR